MERQIKGACLSFKIEKGIHLLRHHREFIYDNASTPMGRGARILAIH
jgi:putative transposon-encoded protein